MEVSEVVKVLKKQIQSSCLVIKDKDGNYIQDFTVEVRDAKSLMNLVRDDNWLGDMEHDIDFKEILRALNKGFRTITVIKL